MIDRKALRITFFLLFAMIAATVWRISLLPDWHEVPMEGPGDIRTIPVLGMFFAPLTVLFVIGVFFASGWFIRSGSAEAVQALRRRRGWALLFVAGVIALAQGFNIGRSLGALQFIDRHTMGLLIFVAAGVFMMVIGNLLPKMPWLTERFRPLDPAQWNRHVRFAGRLMVLFGLVIAVGVPLLPVHMASLAPLGLTLAFTAVIYWHRARVRRDSSLVAGIALAVAVVTLGGVAIAATTPWLFGLAPPPGFEQGADFPKLIGRWSFSTDGAPNSVQFNADGTMVFQRGARGRFWLRGDRIDLYLGGQPVPFAVRFLSDREFESIDIRTGEKNLMARQL